MVIDWKKEIAQQNVDSLYGLNDKKMAESIGFVFENCEIINAKCPTQTNYYDCGIHAAVNALKVVKCHIKKKPFNERHLFSFIRQSTN